MSIRIMGKKAKYLNPTLVVFFTSVFLLSLSALILSTIEATAALYPEIVDPHTLLESSHRFDFHCCRKHTVTHSLANLSHKLTTVDKGF